MITDKFKRICKELQEQLRQPEKNHDLYFRETVKKIHLFRTIFMVLYSIMILLSIEIQFTCQDLRTVICTAISIIFNLIFLVSLCTNSNQFQYFYLFSLIFLWLGLFASAIDDISEQVLQKSLTIIEVQVYFCYFLLFRNHIPRIAILFFGYLRISLGFELSGISSNSNKIIGLSFFIISFIFFIIFFAISKQNQQMTIDQKNKEQLRNQELENILNNDIQQGIMIVTPKTTQSLLSINDLKVKYVNNYFLNQFNVSRQDALGIIPRIYASSIKHYEDGGEQKESMLFKQQAEQNGVRDKSNSQGIENEPLKRNIISQKQNATSIKNILHLPIKPAIKLNKLPEIQYNSLHHQDYHELTQSMKINNQEDQIEPHLIHHSSNNQNIEIKKNIYHNNYKNEYNNNLNKNDKLINQNVNNKNQANRLSVNSKIYGEHSQNMLIGVNKLNMQVEDKVNVKNDGDQQLINVTFSQKNEKLQGIQQINLKKEQQNLQQLVVPQIQDEKDENSKIIISQKNLDQSPLHLRNDNQKQNKYNSDDFIIREGSNKNIHATTTIRARMDSTSKLKLGSKQSQQQQQDGFVNLLDRINYYHTKYLQKKDKNISLSNRNSSDEHKYAQSLIIWEYKQEEQQIHSVANSQYDQSYYKQNEQIHNQNLTYPNPSLYQRQQDGLHPSHINEDVHLKKSTDMDYYSDDHKIPFESEKNHFNFLPINSPKQQEKQILNLKNNTENYILNSNTQNININHKSIEQVQNYNLPTSKSSYQFPHPVNSASSFQMKQNILFKQQNQQQLQPQQQQLQDQQNIQENTNLQNGKSLSISNKPSNPALLNNLNQELIKGSAYNNINLNNNINSNNNVIIKNSRRVSNFGHDRMISKKIDENILEITKDKRKPSSDNGVVVGDKKEIASHRYDDDDDEEWENGRQYLEIKLVECEMDKEESIMIIVNNINQRIKYERLEEIQTKNDQMLANVTHDLKTPLNCMALMVEGMKIDKQYNEVTLNMILENANLLMCLIQDILDYSQIKKGKLRLVQSYFSVSDIIQEVINLFQMQADQKNIKLISNIYRSSLCSMNSNSNANIQNNGGSLQQFYINTRNHNNSLATNIEMQSNHAIQMIQNSQNYKFNNTNTITNEPIKNIQMHQDKNRIKQILINLISNALKFTQEGQIEIRCELKDMEEHTNIKIVEFTVQDTGVGMNPHIKSQLFKMFNTFDQKGLNKNGIGLGLTICKRLVTFLGPSDHIDVESEVSKGSSFTFKVYKDLEDIGNTHHTYSDESEEESPDTNSKQMFHDIAKSIKQNLLKASILKDEDQIEDSQIVVNSLPTSVARPNIPFLKIKDINKNILNTLIPEEETPNSRQQKVFNMLVVDDQPFNIVAFKLILKNFKQISITEAYDGKDAFEKYQKQKYHFVFMDYNMPIMNGCESTKLIRLFEKQNNLSPCKIIIVSGFDEHQKEFNKAMQGGADDYLTKPLNLKIISEKLNAYMNN